MKNRGIERKIRYSILLLTAAWTVTAADRPAPQREYTIRSLNGKYEFTMNPGGSAGDTQPFGTAFNVTLDDEAGSLQSEQAALWRVEGWYSPQTFISNDGHSLVRMGPWASKPLSEELAIAFYSDGREVRRYVVADLIEDESTVRRSVSHYTWLAADADFPRIVDDGQFQLRTIEGQLVTFDLLTGEIADRGRNDAPPDASETPEIAGTWQSGPCSGRNFYRTLHMNADSTFEALDRTVVSFQGTWHTTRPTTVRLVPETTTRNQYPLAQYLDFRGGVLIEATPGSPADCTYARHDQPTGQATSSR
jgi:hypothetical protein